MGFLGSRLRPAVERRPDSPGSRPAAWETAFRGARLPGRRTETSPRRAGSPHPARALPAPGEATRRAPPPQRKPAASCDRTQFDRDALHARRGPLCRLRLLIRRRRSVTRLRRPFPPARLKCKGRPEGRPLGSAEALWLSLDAGRKPVVPGSSITGDPEAAYAERHERPSGGFRRRIRRRPVRQADGERPITRRDRDAARVC